MWLGDQKGNLVDWSTQKWVQATGRNVDLAQNPWLSGPIGSTRGIGVDFFDKWASDKQWIVTRCKTGKGLLSTFDGLASPGFDSKTIQPAVANFYERAADIAPIERIGGSHLRVSLNAFSFLELLNANAKDPSTGLDLFGVCDFCAKHNFDAVDLTGYFFPGYPNSPKDRYLIKLKRHAFDLGLEISGTGVRNDFTAADEAVRKEGVQRIKTWIEVAATLGAPVIRAFADSQPPFRDWRHASGNADRDAVEEWVADSLRECSEYGQKFGVIVAVQNHGDFINTGEQHVSLLKRVNHKWCAALVDTGKYLTADPCSDIALAAPYAANWQIKETLGSTMDSPRVDMKRLLTIIRKSGYRGNIPIETLSMKRKDYDPFVEVPKVLGELREAIEATIAIKPASR